MPRATYINRATRLHVDASGRAARTRTIANYYPRRLIMSLPRSLTPTDLRTSLRNNERPHIRAKEKVFVNLFHRHYSRIRRIWVLFGILWTNWQDDREITPVILVFPWMGFHAPGSKWSARLYSWCAEFFICLWDFMSGIIPNNFPS